MPRHFAEQCAYNRVEAERRLLDRLSGGPSQHHPFGHSAGGELHRSKSMKQDGGPISPGRRTSWNISVSYSLS